jgi:hypothetical protein
MANFQINPRAITQYDTISHHLERFEESGTDPYRFNWRAVHGTTLGADFKLALKKLEGILYVISGGQPDYANGKQWYDVEHPRCRWLVEQWEEKPTDIVGEVVVNFYEAAALGEISGAAGSPIGVAVRSRSGDPRAQFKRAQHTDYFPFDSVQRTDGHKVHDPASTFKPFLTWPNSEDVKITYTSPVGKTATSARVYRSTGSPIGMVPVSPGVWEATIPSHTQGTWVDWYIRAEFSDDPGKFHYDPFVGVTGGIEDTPVYAGEIPDPEHGRAANAAYSFVFYSHFNPYQYGLPELLDENEPHTPGNWLRRCTDSYLFDNSADIQPGLINLARYTLDYIGRYLTEHDPDLRPDYLCCWRTYIVWRWTGSNTPDLYEPGGKGGVSGTDPLHNKPSEPNAGDLDKRRSWRGNPSAWSSDTAFTAANFDYGGDESWLTPPSRLLLESDPYDDPIFKKNLRKYKDRGLHYGDVIDPIHIQEIIDAVDYLMTNGLVTRAPIHTQPYTFNNPWGHPCGWIDGDSSECPFSLPCGESIQHNRTCCSAFIPPDTCIPHDPPATWADCNLISTCRLSRWSSSRISSSPTYGTKWWRDESVSCNGESEFTEGTISAQIAQSHRFGGVIYNGYTPCRDCVGLSIPSCDYPDGFRRSGQFGASYYLCGPPWAYLGPVGDGDHGNGHLKTREGYVGQGPSMGNKFEPGSVSSCATTSPNAPEPDFESITSVIDYGVASSWYKFDDPASLGPLDLTPPSIPGLGNYNWRGEPLFYITHTPHEWAPCAGQYVDDLTAEIAPDTECNNTWVYVKVDMNKDSEGIPTLFNYDLSISNPYDDCPCRTYRGPDC